MRSGFKKIAVLDVLNLLPQHEAELQNYSETPIVLPDADPPNEEESAARAAGADCLLVSWKTPVTKMVMETCPNLVYIGLAATSFAKVDLTAAAARQVTVTNVVDYGDEATAEYVLMQLLKLVRGETQTRWDEEARELHGKRLGIIGLGAVGTRVAEAAVGFGMEVAYFSRTRKKDLEGKLNIAFLPLKQLLQTSDVVSLHVPRDTLVMTAAEFALMKPKSILVNVCVGRVMETEAFGAWIGQEGHFAVLDACVERKQFDLFCRHPRVLAADAVAGYTHESRERLGAKTIQNLKGFLSGEPKNVVA
jgi:hypothetical protein